MANATATIKTSLLQNAQTIQPDTFREFWNFSTIAAAGTTQANATAIGNEQPFVLISNNTTANGVRLPVAAYKGQEIVIYPQLATDAPKVYPPVGGTINSGSVDAAVTVSARNATRFVATNDSAGLTWISFSAPTSLVLGVSGTFTANGATAVTVADTSVTANSNIIFTLKTVGGTVGAIPRCVTITPGTGFNVNCTASDTSVYNYRIL